MSDLWARSGFPCLIPNQPQIEPTEVGSCKPIRRYETYLSGLPTDTCNYYGLSKTLLTRRETIRIKHLMKALFVYRVFSEEELDKMFQMMNVKDLMQYVEFLTNQIRGIYKITRDYEYEDADQIVKADRFSFIDLIRVYKAAAPIVVVDFDKTITNRKFHSLYRWFVEEGISVFINSANPSEEVIESYLKKEGLPKSQEIFANKGKRAKIIRLKSIASKYISRPRFFIDDELEYLLYGNLLCYQCYRYTSSGKIKSETMFLK